MGKHKPTRVRTIQLTMVGLEKEQRFCLAEGIQEGSRGGTFMLGTERFRTDGRWREGARRQ